MTIYIRDENNNTIVDIEIFTKTEDDVTYNDVSASVQIDMYSNLLLSNNIKDKKEFINTISDISDIRAFVWEILDTSDRADKKTLIDKIKEKLRIVEKYNLFLVED